jgi:hypothetical protein
MRVAAAGLGQAAEPAQARQRRCSRRPHRGHCWRRPVSATRDQSQPYPSASGLTSTGTMAGRNHSPIARAISPAASHIAASTAARIRPPRPNSARFRVGPPPPAPDELHISRRRSRLRPNKPTLPLTAPFGGAARAEPGASSACRLHERARPHRERTAVAMRSLATAREQSPREVCPRILGAGPMPQSSRRQNVAPETRAHPRHVPRP